MAFASGSLGSSFVLTDKNTPLPVAEVTLSEIPEEDLPSFSGASAEYHHGTEIPYGTSIKTPLNEEVSPDGEEPKEGQEGEKPEGAEEDSNNLNLRDAHYDEGQEEGQEGPTAEEENAAIEQIEGVLDSAS